MREHRVRFAEDLDKLRCTVPGCDCRGEVYLHSRCHFDAPTWACYRTGVLTISCSECGRVVNTIAVAERGSAPIGSRGA